MTTQSNLRISALAASILIVSTSFAQLSTVNNLQPSLANISSVKVYENVTSEFQKHFAGAENVRWYPVQNKYLAKFSMGNVEKRALLNRKGELIYEITHGKEQDLPTNIRKHVKSTYVEFTITAATLVEEANRSIWVINIEDDSKYVIVRVENDELEEVRNYTKVKS